MVSAFWSLIIKHAAFLHETDVEPTAMCAAMFRLFWNNKGKQDNKSDGNVKRAPHMSGGFLSPLCCCCCENTTPPHNPSNILLSHFDLKAMKYSPLN